MPVFLRVGGYNDRIYLDLCNDRWECIEITGTSWRIVAHPPVRFRRAKGMLSLPYPANDSSIEALRALINIGNEENWVLLLSWLASAFRPQGPYPILAFQGEQGCAKSSLTRIVRRLIDPSSAPTRKYPRDERDLMIAANNSWILAYDNLSSIPQWLSDALCRLATGGGFSTRELYTDSEEIIFDAMRPVILNGIDHLPDRPDLAERTITLNLPPIEARISEKQLYLSLDAALPGILGALLDAISVAIRRLAAVKLAILPRMADSAIWSVAAEPGLGLELGAFMAAYGGNRAEAVTATLESDPVAIAISRFVEVRGQWAGTCGELLKALDDLVEDQTKKAKSWPKTPRALSSALRSMVTFLREVGIEVLFRTGKGTHGARRLTIARKDRYSTATTATGNKRGQENQRVDPSVGGGLTEVVANREPRAAQPPPERTLGKPSNSLVDLQGGGEGGGLQHSDSECSASS
jgi:hypothetical protein